MQSAAHFKNHPIHPMLIPFPIAFLIGGTVADFVGTIGHRAGWSIGASYLLIAGVVTALLAAVPGAVDYFRSVPPKSSGRKARLSTRLVMVSVVVIFIIAIAPKGWPPREASVVGLRSR